MSKIACEERRCVPPSSATDSGIDAWEPIPDSHYTVGRHWDGKAQAWVFDLEPDGILTRDAHRCDTCRFGVEVGEK